MFFGCRLFAAQFAVLSLWALLTSIRQCKLIAMLHTEQSAANPARPIQEGDLVVVYEGFDNMKAVRVTANGQYNNKYGSFAHKVGAQRQLGEA